MNPGRSKRERKQQQAIAALLTERTHALAAVKVGISETTLHRWLKDPTFQCEYRAARRTIVETALARLQSHTSDAVETLHRNLNCGINASEICAAKAILDNSLKAIDQLDLLERIEALEAAQAQEGTDATP